MSANESKPTADRESTDQNRTARDDDTNAFLVLETFRTTDANVTVNGAVEGLVDLDIDSDGRGVSLRLPLEPDVARDLAAELEAAAERAEEFDPEEAGYDDGE